MLLSVFESVLCLHHDRVAFLKYMALKHTLFSVHTIIKHIFKIRITAFTVGYSGRVLFKVPATSCSCLTFSYFSCEVT
jgi:hypothetical protein